jgi:hypothetical protein
MPTLKLDLPVKDLSKKRSHHDAVGGTNDESTGLHDERNNDKASGSGFGDIHGIAVAKDKAKAPTVTVKGGNNSKAKKEKKDPNAPKRASPSFIHYQNAMRPKLKIEMPDLSFGDTARIISERWRILTIDERRKYDTMYEEDKKRYEREMIVYTGSLVQAQVVVKKGMENEITAKASRFGGPPESVNVSLYVADLLECGSAETTVEDAIDTQHTKKKKTSSPYFAKGARSLIHSLDASTVNDIVAANNVSAATDDEPTIKFEINKENTVGDDEKIVFEGLGKSILAMTSKSKSPPAKHSLHSSSPNHKPSSTTPTIGGTPRSYFAKVTASDKIIAELDLMKSPAAVKSNQMSEKLSVKHIMKANDDDDQSIASSSSNDSIWDAGLSSARTKGRASICDSGNAGQGRGVAGVDNMTSDSGNLRDDVLIPSLIATSAEVTFEGSAKSIVVGPGRLGLTITVRPASFRGARIDAIDPVCPFCDEVTVGDRIVTINDKEVMTPADCAVGLKGWRKLSIVRGESATDRDETTPPDSNEYLKRDFGTKNEVEECVENLETRTNVDSGVTSIYDDKAATAEDTTNEKVLKSSSKLQSSEQDDFIDDPFTTYAEDTTSEKVLKSSSKLQGSEQDDSIDDPTPVKSIKLNLVPMTRLECQKALLANKITYPDPEYLVAGGPSEYNITRATIMLEDKEVVKLGRNDLTNIKWSAVSRELCDISFGSNIAYVTMKKVAAQHAVFLNGSELNRPVGVKIRLKDSDIISLYGPTGFAYRLNLV